MAKIKVQFLYLIRDLCLMLESLVFVYTHILSY